MFNEFKRGLGSMLGIGAGMAIIMVVTELVKKVRIEVRSEKEENTEE